MDDVRHDDAMRLFYELFDGSEQTVRQEFDEDVRRIFGKDAKIDPRLYSLYNLASKRGTIRTISVLSRE